MLHSTPLTFSYPDGPAFSFPEVHAGAGEELLLLGSSGTGKTTLLHLLAGLRSAQSGRIELAGQDIVPLTEAQRDRHRGEYVGIVFQTAHFLDALTVMDNLCMPQYLNGQAPDRSRAQEMLDRLQLGHKAGSRPRNLSVGEQQRVAIARALMHRPKLVFADEPTSALDDANATEVMNLLREQTADAGATLVVVTHDQRLKDRIANTIAL
ncbi:MAG: ABC transporter ATP-binding protein [Flavobacteriales bacterium]